MTKSVTTTSRFYLLKYICNKNALVTDLGF